VPELEPGQLLLLAPRRINQDDLVAFGDRLERIVANATQVIRNAINDVALGLERMERQSNDY
jgi:hypothetical protein